MRYRTLREAERALVEGEKLWAGQYRNGSSYFLTCSPEIFWRKYMVAEEKTYCEIIRSGPCHLFLDIDGGDTYAIWSRLRKDLDLIFGGLSISVNYVVLTADKEGKNSMHIICRGNKWCLSHPRDGLAILRRLRQFGEKFLISTLPTDWDYIDSKIYTKNRQFRMLGCSKANEIRPFLGLPLSYNHWLSSLVQPLVDLPIGCEVRPVSDSTVIDDSIARKWLPSSVVPERIYHPLYSWVWIVHHRGCRFANRKHRKNHNYVVLDLEKQTMTWKCHHCVNRRYCERLVTGIDIYKELNFVF